MIDFLTHLKRHENVLREAGIARIEGEFSGCSDSGQIDFVAVYDTNNDQLCFSDLAPLEIEIQKEQNTYRNGNFEKQITIETVSLEDFCWFLIDTYSMTNDIDWYNDSGGSGHCYITLTDDDVLLDCDTSVNIIEVCTEHSSESSLTDLLEEELN